MARRLVIILGPTGVGKTDWSISRAQEYGSPILSCDSRQIYRDMTIGTAVPSAEQLAAVQHHFIQILPVTEPYTAGQYETDALALIRRLFDEGHETLVMTGGSMLYIDAVVGGFDALPAVPAALRAELHARLAAEGAAPLAAQLRVLDPETWAVIDRANGQRVVRALEVCIASGRPYSSFKTGAAKARDFTIEKVGLRRPRARLYERIDRRVLRMVDDGLVEEARTLLPYRDLPALRTVGYRELFEHFDGRRSLDEAVALIQQHTRNYAKRQLTWWRQDQSIRWVDLG